MNRVKSEARNTSGGAQHRSCSRTAARPAGARWLRASRPAIHACRARPSVHRLPLAPSAHRNARKSTNAHRVRLENNPVRRFSWRNLSTHAGSGSRGFFRTRATEMKPVERSRALLRRAATRRGNEGGHGPSPVKRDRLSVVVTAYCPPPKWPPSRRRPASIQPSTSSPVLPFTYIT